MLQILKSNPRYFTDGSGKAIYLAGSHTWGNFRDYGITNPPPAFNFNLYLDFLIHYNHNFFRLWTWELPYSAQGMFYAEKWHRLPFPWLRTGPGLATDGNPKFDLQQFDQTYFDMLRSRVSAAGERGIYVAVMMFDGFSPQFDRNNEDGFPYDGQNNINGISCGGKESQSLTDPGVTRIQETYVRKVIDTVNDLDNVMYEIANEAGPYSTQWQYHFIDYIKDYELSKPYQHPVGMTFQFEGGADSDLFSSKADWISPSGAMGYGCNPIDPPAADGSKVVVNDTDHSFYFTGLKETGPGGHREWVWKNFTRGNHLAFMDPYQVVWPERNLPVGQTPDPYWETMRLNMGYVRLYAEKMNLAKMKPMGELASSGYCLANPAQAEAEYLVYLPGHEAINVDLSSSPGKFQVEWFDPITGEKSDGGLVDGGEMCAFTPVSEKDAVLYIRQAIG